MRVSRIPVREAIKKLEQDGLVESSGRGFAVKSLTREEIEETFGIRSVLESYAAFLATEQMNDGVLEKLRGSIEAYRNALGDGDYGKTDAAQHPVP